MAWNRSNIVRVKNISGTTIPAKSFAKISEAQFGEYSLNYNSFDVVRPDEDNMEAAKLLFVPQSLADDDIGLAFIDGFFWVTKTTGETIVAGDKVGTDANEFTAIKIDDDTYGNNDGQFLVLGVDGDDLLVRPRVRESAIWSAP